MENLTLKDLLLTQDMGEKHVNKICNQVEENTFDAIDDPIAALIIKAWENTLREDAITDLQYAINQLTKAKIRIQNA